MASAHGATMPMASKGLPVRSCIQAPPSWLWFASVLDGVRLGDVVQQGRGPNQLHVHVQLGRSRGQGQPGGHAGHRQAVLADVGKHAVFLPPVETVLVGRGGRQVPGAGEPGRRKLQERLPGRSGSFYVQPSDLVVSLPGRKLQAPWGRLGQGTDRERGAVTVAFFDTLHGSNAFSSCFFRRLVNMVEGAELSFSRQDAALRQSDALSNVLSGVHSTECMIIISECQWICA